MQKKGKRSTMPHPNRRIALWLALCFPIGLALLWRADCRWHRAAKICATSVVASLVIAALVIPGRLAPKQVGGVQYVGANPAVEVYGPELPASAEGGVNYDSILYKALVTPQPTAKAQEVIYVYATTDGKCYHTASCKYYSVSAHRLTLYQAHFSGYAECATCRAGTYTPGT